MRTSALFEAKNFGFFENFGVSERTMGKGVKPVRTSGEGSIVLRFCADVFYGRPLILFAIKFKRVLNPNF